ncbi:MAG: efflux RND transporter periplasmic adaptor subunit [Planctomycetota bacterium]|jgi:RND family efflux transporter MFP subunit
MPRRRLTPLLRTVAIAAAFVVVVALLMAWLVGAFRPKVGEGEAAAIERPVGSTPLVEVVARTMPRVEPAVGTVRAVHETTVASKLLARVEELPVLAGQAVGRGDLLVRLDDDELRARLEQAQAAGRAAAARRQQADSDYDRMVQAFERGAATRSELDRATTARDAAVAEYDRTQQAVTEMETMLGEATVRSPMDGVVIDKQVEVGDTVVPGQALVTLYDPTRMQLVASVRESLTERLEVGQTIGVAIEALGKTCEGTVSEIVPEAAAASRAFTVKVTGPCPAGVYSGMFGRLLIPLDDERVLLIPRAAVRQVGQLHVVDVADGDRLRRRVVELGRAFGDEVEVLAGLRAGERIAAPAGGGRAERAS